MSLDMFFPGDIEHIIAGTAEAGRYVGAENYGFRAGWIAALRAVALSFGVTLDLPADNNIIDMQACRELSPIIHAVNLQRITARRATEGV
jgi:hypothetical protein